ncbi:MAG TPA: NADH-quinone oxidoreductase subunit NuoH [Candidatus Latescibacteria bacterium]|nr:NADH-quinone oxidoreductase subunit NuoH [Candidatus Latescibacterota bacterium]
MQEMYETLLAALGAERVIPFSVGFAVLAVVFALFAAIMGAVVALIMVLAERKISADIQERIGPNRVGPMGFFQTVADAVKLLTKENVLPRKADSILHYCAPTLVFTGALLPVAAIAWSNRIVAADLNIGVLYVVGTASFGVIGRLMAGWASNNKWSLLGGMRAAGQMISYEIPNSIAILSVIVLAGTLNLQELSEAQMGGIHQWFVFRSPFAFVACLIYLVSSLAEVNRTPFDLPEAESELVSGYHTEYSGIRWAIFMMSEYIGMVVVNAVAVALFFGGWNGGLPGEPLLGGWIWYLLKIAVLMYCQVWIRFVLPRLRIDQLMSLCWKNLVPLGFLALLGASVQALLGPTGQRVMMVAAWLVFGGFVTLLFVAVRKTRHVPAQGGFSG